MSLNGFEWNQAELENLSPLNNGLISIIAFTSDRRPMLIGTAFVIGAYGSSAIAVTAAHNFQEILDTQNPHKRHHPTALPEFLPKAEPINLDKKLVRACCMDEGRIEMCVFGWAAWDKKADIAIFSLLTQNRENMSFFKSNFVLEDAVPKVGEEVALIGYADMAVLNEERDGIAYEKFTMKRQLMLRRGLVTHFFPDGHLLCRGPCVETSIPVFSGMSGGLVSRLGIDGEAIKPFGVISSDPYDDQARKYDRSIRGASIIALLGTTFVLNAEGQKQAMLKLNEVTVSQNNEVVGS